MKKKHFLEFPWKIKKISSTISTKKIIVLVEKKGAIYCLFIFLYSRINYITYFP